MSALAEQESAPPHPSSGKIGGEIRRRVLLCCNRWGPSRARQLAGAHRQIENLRDRARADAALIPPTQTPCSAGGGAETAEYVNRRAGTAVSTLDGAPG